MAHAVVSGGTVHVPEVKSPMAREYPRAIEFLQGLNPPVRFIATTATATQAARTAIKEKLKFGPTNDSLKFNPRDSKSFELILPIYRENIKIQVR